MSMVKCRENEGESREKILNCTKQNICVVSFIRFYGLDNTANLFVKLLYRHSTLIKTEREFIMEFVK